MKGPFVTSDVSDARARAQKTADKYDVGALTNQSRANYTE